MSAPITSVTLTLDRTPPIELTPNRALRRGGKYAYDAAAAVMKQSVAAVKANWFAAVPAGTPLPIFRGAVAVDVAIYWEQSPREKKLRSGEIRIEQAFRTRLDLDGAIGALKSSFDGLQPNIVANDRQIKTVSVEQFHDVDRAGTMTITVRDIGQASQPCEWCGAPVVNVWAMGVLVGLYCDACEYVFTLAAIERRG